MIKLSDEATKKITYIHQIAYAIPSSEPDEPIIVQMQIQGAGAYDIRRYILMSKTLSPEEVPFIYKSSQPDSSKTNYVKNEHGMSGTTCLFGNKLTSQALSPSLEFFFGSFITIVFSGCSKLLFAVSNIWDQISK